MKRYNCLKAIDDMNKKLLKKGFSRWGKTGMRKMGMCLRNCCDMWNNGMRNFFRRWNKNCELIRLRLHGDRVKAFFIIKSYMKKASLGTNGMVGEAFFALYLESLKFKNNRLLQSAMGMSKGSVTVEAFLFTLYRNALRLGFDAIKYKNSTYRMQ
jgi:hypothetical protein